MVCWKTAATMGCDKGKKTGRDGGEDEEAMNWWCCSLHGHGRGQWPRSRPGHIQQRVQRSSACQDRPGQAGRRIIAWNPPNVCVPTSSRYGERAWAELAGERELGGM